MTDALPLKLHWGSTTHRRLSPFVRGFTYKLFMIDIDIDQLDAAGRQCRYLSVGCTNLFSFDPGDHGDCGNTSLREWADAEFAQAGLNVSRAEIRLLTFPRHMLYKFAPISLWVARIDGKPAGVIYEVRNTFGERHTYVARLTGERGEHSAPKQFHVSPFFGVTGNYQFALTAEEAGTDLGVTNIVDGVPVHHAHLTTRSKPASDSDLIRAAVRLPFSTLGVTLAIHWQALRLWLKGAKYQSRPKRRGTHTTVAASETNSRDERAA